MERRSILLIYNASAGKRRVSQELEAIITGLTNAGCLVTACPVLPGQEPHQVLTSRWQQFEAVVCCGGDGTLHYTVEEILTLPRLLPVGYLPYGSTNDFAASLGLKQRSLEESCAAIGQFVPRMLDVGRFNEQHFCYVAAFGLFTAVSYETPQATKNLLGHFAYLLEGMLRLKLSQGWKGSVTIDGDTLEGEFWYGSVSNSTYIAGMAAPDQASVKMDDGLFEVMLIRKPQNLAETSRLIASLLNQKGDEELLYLRKARRVEAVLETPTSWTLDGEAGPEVTHAVIEAQEKAFALLM